MEPSVICTKVQKLLGTIRFQLQQLEDGTIVSRSMGGGSSFSSAAMRGGTNGSNPLGNNHNNVRIMNDEEEEARANLTQNLNATFQELSILDRAVTENGGVKRDYYRKYVFSLGIYTNIPFFEKRTREG